MNAEEISGSYERRLLLGRLCILEKLQLQTRRGFYLPRLLTIIIRGRSVAEGLNLTEPFTFKHELFNVVKSVKGENRDRN